MVLNDSPSIALLSAFFANAINLKGVAGSLVAMPAPKFLFDLPYLFGEEFDGRAALRTHHVVMAAPVVLVFIARDAVVESDFAGQTAAGEKLKCPIDG